MEHKLIFIKNIKKDFYKYSTCKKIKIINYFFNKLIFIYRNIN